MPFRVYARHKLKHADRTVVDAYGRASAFSQQSTAT